MLSVPNESKIFFVLFLRVHCLGYITQNDEFPSENVLKLAFSNVCNFL